MTEKSISLDLVLSQLPVAECQKYLFKRLDHKTLKSARCVNKLWQSLVDPMMNFKVELSDATKKYVAGFGSDRCVQTVSTTSFHGAYPKNGIDLNTHMLRVTVNVLDGQDSFENYRRKKKNKDGPRKLGISQYNFRRLMQDFNYVSKLHIASLAVKSFRNPKLLSKVKLPNLKEVIVTFFDGGFHQLIPFLRNQFPTLQIVNIANVAETRKERYLLYSWIYGFVANHFKTLKDLTLIFPEGMLDEDEDDLPFGLLLMDDHRMPSWLYERAIANLKKMELEKFILDMSTMEGVVGRYDMGLTLLNSQTKLTLLNLDNLHIKDIGLWRNVENILEKCSETLTSLSLGGCFCGPSSPAGTHTFSCSWLKNCKKLEELDMIVCGLLVDAIEDLPKSLKILNLGHMLKQDQIEYIALNLINLETWVIPQRGSLVSMMVPKVSLYLFEAVLHLPKLTKINLSGECAERDKILDFVAKEEGIHRCSNFCPMEDERRGNLNFHIDRKTFLRDHSCLRVFMEKNRREPAREMDHHDVLEFVIRNLLDGRDIHFQEFVEEDDEDDFPDGFVRFMDFLI